MLDADGRVASWNAGAERSQGYRADEIIGQPFARFFPAEDVALGKPDQLLRGAATEGRIEDEGWRVRKDGSKFWGDLVLSALRDETGALRGFSVVVRDVTQRKLGEQLLRESREQLRALSAHLLSAREEERTAIAREIHDEFGQALTGLKMDLSWLSTRLPAGQPTLIEKAKAMSSLIDSMVKNVRRIAMELRPGLLDDLGILPAMEWYAHEFQARTGIQCQLTVRQADLQLDRDRATAVFRIFQEALTNVARHANATRVTARLKIVANVLVLEVEDNGTGIAERDLSSPTAFGLIGMRERALLLGGEVRIRGKPARGTIVTAKIPLGQ
jgi:PAS domain S-box-containing protein